MDEPRTIHVSPWVGGPIFLLFLGLVVYMLYRGVRNKARDVKKAGALLGQGKVIVGEYCATGSHSPFDLNQKLDRDILDMKLAQKCPYRDYPPEFVKEEGRNCYHRVCSMSH